MLVLIYWSWCHQLGGGGKGGKGPPVKYSASSILRRTNSSSASSYNTVHELAQFGLMKLNTWRDSQGMYVQKITLLLKKKCAYWKKHPIQMSGDGILFNCCQQTQSLLFLWWLAKRRPTTNSALMDFLWWAKNQYTSSLASLILFNIDLRCFVEMQFYDELAHFLRIISSIKFTLAYKNDKYEMCSWCEWTIHMLSRIGYGQVQLVTSMSDSSSHHPWLLCWHWGREYCVNRQIHRGLKQLTCLQRIPYFCQIMFVGFVFCEKERMERFLSILSLGKA